MRFKLEVFVTRSNTPTHRLKRSFISQRENGKLHYEPVFYLVKQSTIYTRRLRVKASDLGLFEAVDLFICKRNKDQEPFSFPCLGSS